MSDNRCTWCEREGHRADHCPQEPWKLKLKAAAIFAVLLSGCGTIGDLNQRVVDRADPTVVHDAKGRAWIWLQGVVPLMRLKEADIEVSKEPPPSRAEPGASGR